MTEKFDLAPDIISTAQNLGHEPDQLSLLMLAPFVQVAWAEGSVQAAEQRAILGFAQKLDLIGHPGYERLLRWFDERPEDAFFEESISYLREILEKLPEKQADQLRAVLRFGCREVALASGPAGFTSGTSNIHRDEREQLVNISEKLGLSHNYL